MGIILLLIMRFLFFKLFGQEMDHWAQEFLLFTQAEENAVYYVQNNNFSQIGKYEF